MTPTLVIHHAGALTFAIKDEKIAEFKVIANPTRLQLDLAILDVDARSGLHAPSSPRWTPKGALR